MGRYKVIQPHAPLNRAQRRAAKKGKSYAQQGSSGKRKGRVQLRPYSESGITPKGADH